jgi:hypothetical protein
MDCRLVVLPLDLGRSFSRLELVVLDRERRGLSAASSISAGCICDMAAEWS